MVNIEEIKKLRTVEYSVLFDRFQTRALNELIKENMDALYDNRQPQYALLTIAESQERADFIITQIKRCMDPELQKKELDEYYVKCRQKEEGLSDLTVEELLKKLNG